MLAIRRCKSDTNQRSIVADLRQLGAVVKPVSMYGLGFDLLVGYRGQLWAVEVKHADTREHLTANERETADTLPAYIVIDSAEDFLRQADDAHRSAIRTLCHGSDFGVLLMFGHFFKQKAAYDILTYVRTRFLLLLLRQGHGQPEAGDAAEGKDIGTQ